MRKRMRALAFLLVFGLLAGCLPAREGKAATDCTMTCITSKGSFQAATPDEAFDILERDGGGTIRMDATIDWTTSRVRWLPANSKIIVPEGIGLTFKGAGIQGPGSIEVAGSLYLKESTCPVFHITGEIKTIGRGEISSVLANLGNLDKTSDTAATIFYGQRLPSERIDDNLIGARVYVSGNWYFSDQTTIYGTGTHAVETYFDYAKRIYRPFDVVRTVNVVVEKATPKLAQYTVPQIELGQALGSVHPQYAFTNPYSGETVNGTLKFADAAGIMNSLGEKQMKASFTPNDSENYNSTELTLAVNVVAASPKVAGAPVAGDGVYEEKLRDIALTPGTCVDAGNGDAVAGSWAWKNPDEPLKTGEHTYTAVFAPEDTAHYKAVEVPVKVRAAAKKMSLIQWPVVSEMQEGQHLFEAELSFDSNEHGTFSWEDDSQIPTMDYKGAVLNFVPFDTENYDWSNVSGYDSERGVVKKTIALQIASKATPTPEPTKEPERTKEPEPTREPERTKEPEPTREPERTKEPAPTRESEPTGEPENTDLPVAPTFPAPTDSCAPANSPAPTNPSASTKQPEETSPSATAEAPEETSPSATAEAPEETSPSATTEAPEETSPSATAEAPEGTSPSMTTEPSKQPGSEHPSESQNPTTSQNPSDSQNSPDSVTPTARPGATSPSASEGTEPPEEDDPVVIKQMVTKISSIKTPKSSGIAGKRTRIKSVRRSGKTVRIEMQKVKGAKKYQVRYSLKKKMKLVKKKKSSKRVIYLRHLKKGRKYYIQARVMKKKKGKRVYSKWSKKKRI